MATICVLPDDLASQVAAGEVVERPASVIKELVENSLDAGAGRVAVLARRGGTALLQVVDDGRGMDREDALMCLKRHATSKIRSMEDLAAVTTKGFRGEALPSIASVSKFTLCTRERDALSGTRVTVEGGKIVEVADAGEAPGTRVEVRQLFYNVPARRKFLRSEDTEFSHIEQQVRVQALAHPEIAFSLTRDDRLLFQLPGKESLRDRVRGLTGPELTERLLEIPRRQAGPVTVYGFIGEAGLSRANRSMQFTFLNRRPVESPVLRHALRAGYGEALPKGASPVVFLFVEIDPREVDVNVHPAKREVRFRRGLAVQNALAGVIAETLRRGRGVGWEPGLEKAEEEEGPSVASSPPVSTLPPPSVVSAPVPVPRWTPRPTQPELPVALPVKTEAEPRSGIERPPERPAVASAGAGEGDAAPVSVLPPPSPEASAPVPENRTARAVSPAAPEFRVLSLLGTRYVVMESADGLVLMDARAAWERVLFEEARARRAGESVESQSLLTPLTVPLSPREFDALKPRLPALRRLGLGVEEFGPNTVVVESLPAFFRRDGDVAALLSALAVDLQIAGERAPRRLDEDFLTTAVARQAARLQPPQSVETAALLVRRLMACDMPYCCPAGRPTLVQMSWQELARKFGR